MASIMRFDTLQNSAGAQALTVNNAGNVYIPGSVVQCQVKRTDTQVAYSCATTGSEFTDLRVSITPKFANSLILCQFQIFGEAGSTHDWTMRVWKNGAVPTGTYAGFNTVQGNQVWSGLTAPMVYESDYNSTPQTSTMMYHDFPGSTSALTYAPGAGHSGGTAYTYYVNRTVGSLGTGAYEVGVSFSVAWEIAQ